MTENLSLLKGGLKKMNSYRSGLDELTGQDFVYESTCRTYDSRKPSKLGRLALVPLIISALTLGGVFATKSYETREEIRPCELLMKVQGICKQQD